MIWSLIVVRLLKGHLPKVPSLVILQVLYVTI